MSAAPSRLIDLTDPSPSAWRSRSAAVLVFALAFAGGVFWPAADDGHAEPLHAIAGSDAVVVSLAHLDLPATHADNDDDTSTRAKRGAGEISIAALPPTQATLLPVWAPSPLALRAYSQRRLATRSAVAALPRMSPPAAAKEQSHNFAVYRALLRFAAVRAIQRMHRESEVTDTIVGIASTYNPFREGIEEGGPETASGELYDPAGWTAAIQIDLRGAFGGVRYGRNYRPAYALVESGDKRLIVRINDVGPLRPGRVIDLNERAMRYFDPTLRRGLLHDVKLTLLPGADWIPGPISRAAFVAIASAD